MKMSLLIEGKKVRLLNVSVKNNSQSGRTESALSLTSQTNDKTKHSTKINKRKFLSIRNPFSRRKKVLLLLSSAGSDVVVLLSAPL